MKSLNLQQQVDKKQSDLNGGKEFTDVEIVIFTTILSKQKRLVTIYHSLPPVPDDIVELAGKTTKVTAIKAYIDRFCPTIDGRIRVATEKIDVALGLVDPF